MIIDEDSVYEIDEMCMRKREEQERTKIEKVQKKKSKMEEPKRNENRSLKTEI